MDESVLLDIGVTRWSKVQAVLLPVVLMPPFGWLAIGLGRGYGAPGATIGTVVFVTVSALLITGAIRIFRYRTWLEGHVLAIQHAFQVRRLDLARADVLIRWAEAQDDPSGPQTGIIAMDIREPGPKRTYRVRLLDSRNRPLPSAQLLALADAIAARDGSLHVSAASLREAATATP
ncbi:hypothetical protein [Actinomadura rupiterrae]|uniref:hypothetical protein n=1 Tax=Actinomadura rupiterrae TaxID=559627 RepID=UPI0020A240AB|nr:hypothetical protein [Actinomadura rupiterrae]MCP2342907.1 hypothetical protein [Actinomadura rupiterrae]